MVAAVKKICLGVVKTTRYSVISYGIQTSIKSNNCQIDSSEISNSGSSYGGSIHPLTVDRRDRESCNLRNREGVCNLDDKIDKITIIETNYEDISISINKNLMHHGCCILKNALLAEPLRAAHKSLQPIVRNLQHRYDHFTDEFEGLFNFTLLYL